MRIGFDAKRAFKNFTGLGNYSRSTIEILAKYYANNQYILYTPPYKAHISTSFASSNNVEICQPKGLWRTFHSTWRSFKLAGQLKKDKIDIFHGLSHELPSGIQNTGVKSVVTMHDLIVLRYPELYKAIDRKIYMKKYKSACLHADLIIAISEQTKLDLIELMGINSNKIRLVYQGCDPMFYNRCDEQQKQTAKQKYQLPDKYILSVGTIETRKRLVTAIKALTQLPDDVYLVAVGKPTDYMREVTNTIDSLNLQNRVRFIHNASFVDFPAIYQQAKAFVYVSIFEGFGIPILEALNSQIPVVAAQASSLPEVGGDAALYIEPDNDSQLSQQLNRIFTDVNLQNDMIERGIKQAAKFREQEIADSLWAVYKELANS